MLGDDPELAAHQPDAHGDAARLAAFAADGFEERASRRGNADRKHEFDGRVEQVFLKDVDDAALHRLWLMSGDYISRWR
jgi:hypothetical protein